MPVGPSEAKKETTDHHIKLAKEHSEIIDELLLAGKRRFDWADLDSKSHHIFDRTLYTLSIAELYEDAGWKLQVKERDYYPFIIFCGSEDES